jgi:hypothetical protein
MLSAPALVCAGGSTADSIERAWIAHATAGLDARAVEALRSIPETDRRLLALRAYLRAGASLPDRWSWSQQRLSGYAATPEGEAAVAEIDAVMKAFASANDGYELRVNRAPRSLELQIARWNENPSVGKTATSLAGSLHRQFGDGAETASAEAVRRALMDWKPSVAAPLAAPGLSAHGQARAFDFQVARRGEIVAGTEFASAPQRWDAAGWTEKLRLAVRASGGNFVGPLASPYEPWHYAYTPPATTPGPAAR